MGIFNKLFGKKTLASKPASFGGSTPDKVAEVKPQSPIIKEKNHIREIIFQNHLRPLGNKKRLTHTPEKASMSYDVRLLLFRDKGSAEKYYHAFVSHAKNNQPPFLMEIMLAFMPKNIYAEKYVIAIPNEQVDTRPVYKPWAMNAIRSCNDTVRVHQSTDHSYKDLHQYVEVVYKWDILFPKDFSDTSNEAKELLSDDPDNGFPALKLLGQEGVTIPPEKPNPAGPWIGVLFEISNFEEALYGRAATALLLKIIEPQYLSETVIHGGDILPECRFWCSAIHTASFQQWERIEHAICASEDRHLAPVNSRFLKGSEVPVGTLPYQGFVSNNGTYVGI